MSTKNLHMDAYGSFKHNCQNLEATKMFFRWMDKKNCGTFREQSIIQFQKEMSYQTMKRHAAKSLQSCPTLCNPIDSSLQGSSVPGILQARTLEWVAISSSNTWKWKVKVKSFSRVRLFDTPWTAAYQAPLSMGFSKSTGVDRHCLLWRDMGEL